MAVSVTIWTLNRSKSSYVEEEKSSPPSSSPSSTTPPGEHWMGSTQLIRCSSSWYAINMISKQQVTSFHRHRSPSSTPSAASRQAWDSQPDDSPIKNHIDKITFCPFSSCLSVQRKWLTCFASVSMLISCSAFLLFFWVKKVYAVPVLPLRPVLPILMENTFTDWGHWSDYYTRK